MLVIKLSRLLTFVWLLSLVACVAPPKPASLMREQPPRSDTKPLIKSAPVIAEEVLVIADDEIAAPSLKTAAQLRDEASLTAPQLQQFKQAHERWRLGQSSEALSLLQGLPPIAAVRYNQILILQQAGQHELAEPMLQVLAQQHYPAASNLLGIQARQRGDFAAAERWYQQALQQQADFAEAHLNLALLYELYLWQPAQALTHYQLYQQLTADPRAEGWIRILQQQQEALSL